MCKGIKNIFIYYENFQDLSICKPLFYKNIKLFTLIFKDINTIQIYTVACNRNMTYFYYDNTYFKCNYKYRISYINYSDNKKN
jgi:hypothetical protein